jgi:hypothetical protein
MTQRERVRALITQLHQTATTDDRAAWARRLEEEA